MLMAEMHSNGSLAVLAQVSLNEKATDISVLVQDWNGCMQSRQRFLHRLGGHSCLLPRVRPALQGGKEGDGGTKRIVLLLSKQHTDKQGWEAAELAPCVAARRWLQNCAGVEVFLQVVAQVTSSTHESDLSFLHNRGGKHSSDRYRCLLISRWMGH